MCVVHWNAEQILHYLSNRFTSKKKKDTRTLTQLIGKASYTVILTQNNTEEHRWDIAISETNTAPQVKANILQKVEF